MRTRRHAALIILTNGMLMAAISIKTQWTTETNLIRLSSERQSRKLQRPLCLPESLLRERLRSSRQRRIRLKGTKTIWIDTHQTETIWTASLTVMMRRLGLHKRRKSKNRRNLFTSSRRRRQWSILRLLNIRRSITLLMKIRTTRERPVLSQALLQARIELTTHWSKQSMRSSFLCR